MLASRAAVLLSLSLAACFSATYPPPTPSVPVGTAPDALRGMSIRLTDVTLNGPRGALDDAWLASARTGLEATLAKAGFRVVPRDGTNEAADLEARWSARAEVATLEVYANRQLVDRLVDPPAKYQCGRAFDEGCVAQSVHEFFAPRIVNLLLASPRVQAVAAARNGGLQISPSAVATQQPGPKPTFVTGRAQPDAFALVVGIEHYRDVPPPVGARRDAETFAEMARTTLGVPDANLRVLLDDRATKSDVERELDWLKLNVPAGGRVYFFFSGHGAPDASEGSSYVLPYEASPTAITRTGLPLQKVLGELGATRAGEVVALVDACFSGAGGRSVLPPGARPLVRMKESKPGAKIAVLSAAGGAQITGPAADGSSGLFTSVLADGLGRGEADGDHDGAVTIGELGRWMAPRVAAAARRQQREQEPTLTLGRGMTERTPLASGLTRR